MALFTGAPADPDGMVAMLRAEDGFDISGRLADITAPTLVIAGGRDVLYPPGEAERLSLDVRDGSFCLYRDRRHHQVMADRRFAPVVLAFLDG